MEHRVPSQREASLSCTTPGRAIRHLAPAFVACAVLSSPCSGQTLSVLQGHVVDPSNAALAGATIAIRNDATGFAASIDAGPEGRYRIVAIPEGTYLVKVEAAGFRTEVITALAIDIGRTVVRDFQLAIADQTETVVVAAEVPLIDRATASVSDVVTRPTIQEIPLNGRHFIDLSQLVPGAVAPSQAGFSARPIRGLGSLAINIAGNREEAVGFVVNGVTINNLTFGSLIYVPPVGSLEEFKIAKSALDAEYGHVSGAIATIVTRTGTDHFRGSLFEFFRNDRLDARNFFEFTSDRPHPFNRNQFGGQLGGPIWRGQTFFFAAYEGMRQRQGVDLNSLVLSDAQRAAASDPVIRQLIPLIPRANYFDAAGTPRFVGSAPAIVDLDQWTIDLSHNAGRNDRFQAFYGSQQTDGKEPTSQGNSIPGFGQVSHPFASLITASETHIAAPTLVNEVRFGRSRLVGGTFPAAPLDPRAFGIANGVTGPVGLPQIVVAGDLNFGGPAVFPQGRSDDLYVFNDTLSRSSGRHSLKLGGEYRHFVNRNFAQGTGLFNFPTVDAFLAGTANAFTTTVGYRTTVIDQPAMSLFVADTVAVHDRVTLDLGVRYEWHVTPTERDNHFVVFDAAAASLERVGVDVNGIYRQNNRNVEPRVGLSWNLGADRRTVLRAAYATAADQPSTTVVRDTGGNPPFAVPLAAAGSISLANALQTTQPVGLAPATVDPDFTNVTLRSWNVNLQRQVARSAAITVGYLGSHGSNLRISRNLNQPVDGVRPFAMLSASSPILPGAPLGNITQVESSGFSNYNGAWVSVTKRLSDGLQLDTSYTWSRSLDTNSLNSAGFAVQNSYDIPAQYGPSDFDARNRFVLSATYALPFTGSAFARGWQVSTIVQSQSGNPVNIVTSNSRLTGAPNTVRPDVTGPVHIVGSVDEWFDRSVFLATNQFGNLGRNAVVGPAFNNTDLSVMKRIDPGPFDLQVRVDVFDLFNHPNFGSPGNIVGSPTFGKVTSTRLPTGEAGSSRQIQLAVRLAF
jgi:Carboxypeptidase regulatory-like domain